MNASATAAKAPPRTKAQQFNDALADALEGLIADPKGLSIHPEDMPIMVAALEALRDEVKAFAEQEPTKSLSIYSDWFRDMASDHTPVTLLTDHRDWFRAQARACLQRLENQGVGR